MARCLKEMMVSDGAQAPLEEKELFFQALELANEQERETFLAAECRGDEALRQRIEKLLHASASDDDLLTDDEEQILEGERSSIADELADESRFATQLGKNITQLGGYELIEEIGRGSMGIVYRARQISLNREVALKIILGASFITKDDRERFRFEAEAAAKLQDPNIVPVYEIGEDDGHDFYSMAYISGGTLGDRFEDIRADRRRAVALMATLARTVQTAHDHGILHRDLKPDNILINHRGEPMISDFGLAYHLDAQHSLTITGQILGTPQYMSPEQADGHSRRITTQTDVYSLGAILYELLSGKPVFKADSIFRTLKLIQEAAPTPLRVHRPGIDRDLETIVSKCLEKRPSDRYRSAKRLAEDLEAWLERRPIAARRPGTAERFTKWIRRRPIHAALLASLTLLLLSLGIGGPLVALQQTKLRQSADAERQNARTSERKAHESADLANRRARANQRLAYASSMQLVALSKELKKRERMAPQAMLVSLNPQDEQPDLRGWEWYYALAEEHSSDIFRGHRGKVHSLSFSLFGEHFVASTPMGTTTYDSLSTPMIRNFENGRSHLSSEWNADGRLIATLDEAGEVILWAAKSAKKLAKIPSGSKIRSFSFGPGTDRLITLDVENRISIWQIGEKPALLFARDPFPTQLEQISWSPQGTYLAARGASKEIYLWETAHLDHEPEIFQGHHRKVTALSWLRNESMLASGCAGNIVRVWGVPGGRRILNTKKKEDRPITHLAWSQNGSHLIHCAEESSDIYEIDFMRSDRTSIKHFSEGKLTALAWSPETFTIVAGYDETDGKEGRMRISRKGLPPTSQTLFSSPIPLSAVHWSPDGTSLSVLTCQGQITSLDSHSGKQKRQLSFDLRPKEQALWNPGGPEIAIISRDRIRIIDPRQPKKRRMLDLPERGQWSAVWFRGKNSIYVCNKFGEIQFLADQSKHHGIRFSHPSEGRYSNLSCSPQGQYLLATGQRNSLCLWQRNSGKILLMNNESGTQAPPLSHAWHPDDTHFAVGRKHSDLEIWSVVQKKKLRTIKAHRGPAQTLAWHPTGDRIASGGHEGDIRIWDWKSGQLVWTLKGHTQELTSLAWSPTGHRLASVSKDGSAVVWDASAGILLSREKVNPKK